MNFAIFKSKDNINLYKTLVLIYEYFNANFDGYADIFLIDKKEYVNEKIKSDYIHLLFSNKDFNFNLKQLYIFKEKKKGNVTIRGLFYKPESIKKIITKTKNELEAINSNHILIIWDSVKIGDKIFGKPLTNVGLFREKGDEIDCIFRVLSQKKITSFFNIDLPLIVDLENQRYIVNERIHHIQTKIGIEIFSNIPLFNLKDKQIISAKETKLIMFNKGKLKTFRQKDITDDYRKLSKALKKGGEVVSGECEICKKNRGNTLMNVASYRQIRDRHCNKCAWNLRNEIIERHLEKKKKELDDTNKPSWVYEADGDW